MAFLYEYRKVKGKNLLIKFVFESSDGLGDKLVCHSLDKYMSVDAWTQLYEKLGKSIDRYVKNDTKTPASDKITMFRAQLELRVSWLKVDEFHAHFCDSLAGDRYSHFMVVSVNSFSRVNEFRRKHKTQNSQTNGNGESIDSDISPQSTTSTRSGTNVGNGVTYNATAKKRPHEEYVPEATTTSPKTSKLRYTPSKMVDADADEYEPTRMAITGVAAGEHDQYGDDRAFVDENAAPDYHPAPLNNNDYGSSYSRGLIRSPRPNKVQATTSKITSNELPASKRLHLDKANSSSDLFGSESDGELVAKPDSEAVAPPRVESSARYLERKAKLVTQRSQSTFDQTKPSTSSTSNKGAKASSASSSHLEKNGKKRSKTTHRSKEGRARELNDQQAKLEKLNESNDQIRAERDRQEVNEIIRQKIEANTLKDASGNPIGLTRVIHLKDLTSEELTGTFQTHEAELRHIFETRKCECPLVASKEYSWFTINQIMITDQQMGAMLDALTMHLTNVEEHGHIPFDKLFWECMLPEWALRIFMDRFVLTRAEALDHLRKHEKANVANAQIDLDFDFL